MNKGADQVILGIKASLADDRQHIFCTFLHRYPYTSPNLLGLVQIDHRRQSTRPLREFLSVICRDLLKIIC